MTTDLSTKKAFTIGKFVYRRFLNPDNGQYWYMPAEVERITPKYVFARYWGEAASYRLKRGVLERTGFCCAFGRGAVFYAELPEDYRKQTLGYLMDEEPRRVLGLGDTFTPDELKDAYRRKVMETHPDRGGSPKDFMAVQAAYERLSQG